ncbi:murein biosynthesis integral membrane protein MurJ [Venenivibrio stagnispumantis]|uniref:Probable lipid II flippase MurJ n=1 Tax=Venenivibrio stagnispumantis TaxID=407998 RepID=A0AA45WJA3_9AQUI|nr:murein biosynthesis integral membrane protein MurJ [Venenivibrio stagnispumantis]MCW4572479.1 murein biosynthesis integral membrane protein MurJ [Venenivibrio stagnispumantis]SMP02389.1 putative peptidoglycan lipid II flippase [Venenivibrio stagnispumantis]
MRFIRNTLIFSIATLISRILGYIRDAVVAYIFGATPLTDAFFVAWRLPNTLRQLVGEGSFNAAFIPIYSSILSKSEQEAKQYASSLFSYYTIVLTFITIMIILFADIFVKILAPGFVEKGNFEETVNLVRAVFPYLILIGWTSFYMALLNTKDIFFVPAVAPALLNLSFIISAFLFAQSFGIYALVIGALVGGLLQFLLQIPAAIKHNLLIKPSLKFHPEIKTTLKRLIPAFASFGVSQFSFVVDTVLASFLTAGAISYLYYGNRIFQLPLGLFIIGLGNALLVSLSKHYAQNRLDEFNKDMNMGIKLAILISIPATTGMIVLGKEIIDILLVRGKFGYQDAEFTFYALAGYSIGLVGYGITRPLKSGFFAIEDMKTPLYSTIFGFVGSIFLAFLFTFIFKMGVFGLALASSMGAFLNVIFLYLKYPFFIDKKGIFITFLKVCISSLFMALVVMILKIFIGSKLLLVFISIFISILSFFFAVYILKEDSFLVFLDIFKRKLLQKYDKMQ